MVYNEEKCGYPIKKIEFVESVNIMEYRNNRNRREAYIEGNVVRKREAAPKYKPQPQKSREELEKERIRKRAAKRNQQKAMSMNLGYVAFLSVATVVCFAVCIMFVHVQSDITARMANIASLETQIAETKADNTAAEKRIETTMNLDQVKAAAAGMGLTYPSQEQIQYYTVENDDYMNQYGEIPSN